MRHSTAYGFVPAMFASIVAVALAAFSGAVNYDEAEHPIRFYDAKVTVIGAPGPGADTACIDRLRTAHIDFRLLGNVEGVDTPVEVLDTSLGLVKYMRAPSTKRRFILDCHTVEVLASRGRALRKAGIATIYWSSAWRYTLRKDTKQLSAHAHGNALDIVAIEGRFGYATVKGHYERGVKGCGENNKTDKGRHLSRFLCAMQLGFDTVYTPDTDAVHADHIHVQDPDSKVKYRPLHPHRRWYLYVLAAIAMLLMVVAGIWWLKQPKSEPREP